LKGDNRNASLEIATAANRNRERVPAASLVGKHANWGTDEGRATQESVFLSLENDKGAAARATPVARKENNGVILTVSVQIRQRVLKSGFGSVGPPRLQCRAQCRYEIGSTCWGRNCKCNANHRPRAEFHKRSRRSFDSLSNYN
jgi:hypothetical protein